MYKCTHAHVQPIQEAPLSTPASWSDLECIASMECESMYVILKDQVRVAEIKRFARRLGDNLWKLLPEMELDKPNALIVVMAKVLSSLWWKRRVLNEAEPKEQPSARPHHVQEYTRQQMVDGNEKEKQREERIHHMGKQLSMEKKWSP
eukprot:m.108729 g.108729  ORF g.108729 m.108729 type:complete len:148 (+) comp15217_c1_seq4:2004-2447(+)